MPRFFIHLRNGDGVQRDDRGEDYASEDKAVQQAARSAGSILSDDLVAGQRTTALKLTVERPDGSPVATISVSATVTRF